MKTTDGPVPKLPLRSAVRGDADPRTRVALRPATLRTAGAATRAARLAAGALRGSALLPAVLFAAVCLTTAAIAGTTTASAAGPEARSPEPASGEVRPASPAKPSAPEKAAESSAQITAQRQRDRTRFRELLAKLGDEHWHAREAAQAGLLEVSLRLKSDAVTDLLDARRSRDAEVAQRAGEVFGELVAGVSLPELLAGAPGTTARRTLDALLRGRVGKEDRAWIEGGDKDFPPALRLASAGMLAAFLEGNHHAAIKHCITPFIRHGSTAELDELTEVWEGLSPMWPTLFPRLGGITAATPKTVPPELTPGSEVGLRPSDRIVAFRFLASPDGDIAPAANPIPITLVFLFRHTSGGWRAAALWEVN